MILYLSFVLISLWSSIEYIGCLIGLFLMLGGGIGFTLRTSNAIVEIILKTNL